MFIAQRKEVVALLFLLCLPRNEEICIVDGTFLVFLHTLELLKHYLQSYASQSSIFVY